MAEAVLYNVADEILGNLGKLGLQEMRLLCNVREEIEKFKHTVSAIKAVLLDAEEQHAKSHEIRDWLGKLKDAFFDADDLLDDFSTVSSSQENGGEKEGETEQEMRVEKYQREQTYSFIRAEEVIGREDDKNAVIGMLLDSISVTENVSVIPIVGIGGIGKTTLAQLVYNDEKIKRHFELRMWVCVSNVFDVKVIVQRVLESARHAKFENLEMESLQAHLRKEIDGRKFLLVLDDLWNEDRDRWLKLRDLFMRGSRGSKIVVTTRTQLVADITGTISSYALKGLPSEESWYLFKEMAFKQGKEPENSGLVAIGKEIVRKCAGVPLAIRSIGSLLYSKDTESERLYFKNSELSETTYDTDDMLSILKLSFDQLPSYLKQCFAYCSLFPKDYEINKQTLVKLWMAQGFIQSSNRVQQLEEIGDHYFLELLRSFFQDVEYDHLGNVVSFKLHDLIHDLAQSVSGSDSSLVDLDAKNMSERIRHVSFDSVLDSSWKIPSPLLKAHKIRTLLLPVQPIYHRILSKVSHDEIVSSFQHLRALDLHNTGVDCVPIYIGKLKHLRYLDLSKNEVIRTLPNSITRLQNLQTLKLSSCKMLEKLPRDTRKMTNLRHLEIDQCIGLIHMPCGLGQLTALQTLSRFVVGKDCSSLRSRGSLMELKHLNNLRGELTIAKLENMKTDASDSKEANLKGKQNLQVLRLEWQREVNDHKIIYEDEELLESLQPHSDLKEFHIYGYRGGRFPDWIISDLSLLLPNLLEIIIWRCHRCLEIPLFSQPPKLKVLKLEEVTAVAYIEISNDRSCSSFPKPERGKTADFFPCLKELRLFDLPNLKGCWRKAIDEASDKKDRTAEASNGECQPPRQKQLLPSFPCLSKLDVGHCPQLPCLPLHQLLEELELKNVNERFVRQTLMIEAKTAERLAANISSSGFHLCKLKHLAIDSIMDLVTLPEEVLQNLPALEHLHISSCPKLLCLHGEAFRGLTSLRFLSISGCGRLRSLPQGLRYLTALEELEIKECRDIHWSNEEEDGMKLQGLKCLCTLKLGDLPKLMSLPDGLQDATSLQNLNLRSCSSLKSLPEWIINLTLLQRLEISECLELSSLLKAMRYVKGLQSLDISKCPQLFRDSHNETSVNWPKIAYVSDISIDGRKICGQDIGRRNMS